MKRANESSLVERQYVENRTLKPHFLLLPHFLRSKIMIFLKIKNPRKPQPSRVFAVYSGRESNPHSLNGNRILSPACLPVPPPEHTQTKDRTILINKKLSQKREFWSRRPGSNRPPRPWQGRALPNELLLLVFANVFRIGRAKVKNFLFLQNFQGNFWL